MRQGTERSSCSWTSTSRRWGTTKKVPSNGAVGHVSELRLVGDALTARDDGNYEPTTPPEDKTRGYSLIVIWSDIAIQR